MGGVLKTVLSEFSIIDLFTSKKSAPRHRLLSCGMGDDAAVFGFPGDSRKWLVTQDLLSDGVHFKRQWISAADLAYKAIAVNLSDLSAMGATPQFLLLSLGLPRDLSDRFIRAFARAFQRVCTAQRLILIGGDTCESARDLTVEVTAIGVAPGEQILHRSGAQAGDHIYTSGPLGASALGLHFLKSGIASPLARRHHRPPIRTAFANALAKSALASAMTDISDGLLLDLETLCRKTLTAELVLDRIPIDRQTRKAAHQHGLDPLSFALSGGEDYELLFTIPAAHEPRFRRWCTRHGHTVYAIGTMTAAAPQRHKRAHPERIQLIDASSRTAIAIPEIKGYQARTLPNPA